MDSYVHGASASPLLGLTVGAMFQQTAETYADNTALVACHQSIRWSYAELLQQADAVADGLLALGLEPGDRVGIWAPNCAEWVVTQFATARAGLVLVNINPAYRVKELDYAIGKVGCKALIVAPEFKSSNYHEMTNQLDGARLPTLETLITLSDDPPAGFIAFSQLAASADAGTQQRLARLNAQLQFDDAINIQFTSGTTGSPKAATLTHHNIVNNALLTSERMGLGANDSLCIPVPMYHCFGMVLGTLARVSRGATMVLPSAGFDPGAVLGAIASERCTAVHGVPTMFLAELDHPDFASFDLSSLRTGIIAGAPCPVELMRRLIGEMHLKDITIAYGMTETGPVSFQTAPTDTVERKVATVGTVLAHTEVKIVDETGKLVPRGTAGELLTRGYCVMRGYWGDAGRTAEAIDASRWLHTGDIAVLDDTGYCQIVGRVKDMLIRGGENIFPREIEEFLFQHPDVESAEVIGVPDKQYGEEICAWIKLRPGHVASEQDMRDFCRDNIAHFKIPRYILFVDEFPMTITGKVQKFKMREQTIASLGLAQS